MFDKMVKMRNKKAFTLVEMLVVIAIIAILVAIVVPIVGKSTTKARAATNAANLRAVEGQLSTVRVSNPDLFLDAVEKLGQPWDTVVGNLNNLDSILSNSKLYQYLKNELGVDTTKELLDYKLCHFTADENGTIVITGKDSNYTLTDVPASVAVSAGGTVGMEVPEGTPMTIWITNNNVVATYETVSGAYVDANFAEVAETGEFNGTADGGDTQASLECAIKHQGPFTDNKDGKTHTCEHCGASNLTHQWPRLDINGSGVCEADGCTYQCKHEGDFGGKFPVYKDWSFDGWYHQCNTCKKWVKIDGDDTPAPTPSPTPSSNPDTGDSGTGGGTGGTGGDETPVEHKHNWQLIEWKNGRQTVYGHCCTDETCEQHTAHEHTKTYEDLKTICSVCGAQYYGIFGWKLS